LTTPGVTVVLPSRDRPALLQRALSCALGQEGVELEVIVVDDGSAPMLDGRVEGLRDPRVTLVRHAVSRGVASARNTGIACAARPLVAFLDDDDVWAPSKLARQVAALESTGAGFSYTGMVWLDGDLRRYGEYHPVAAARLRDDLRVANAIGSPSAVVARTDLVRAVGGFDERLSVLADWELWLRLAERADGVDVDDLLLGYVVHGEGMHVQDSHVVRAELRLIRRTHPGDPAIGGLDFWQWLASSQRRVGNRFAAARTHAHMGLRFHRKRDVGRAIGLVLGPRAMRLGRRSVSVTPTPVPPWLRERAWAEPASPAAAPRASSSRHPAR
jgi:glycosyltransferase involved in cell wall biosynthesis